MLRLILVRHAKSSWSDPGLPDFDRPLAPRGRRAAAWLGEALHRRHLVPSLILCSPAVRTRETLVLSGMKGEVRFEPELYEDRDRDYLEILGNLDGAASPLALVGHNSAMAVTAARLAGGAAVGEFSTAAFAVIDVPTERWQELRAGQGTLVEYCVPPKE